MWKWSRSTHFPLFFRELQDPTTTNINWAAVKEIQLWILWIITGAKHTNTCRLYLRYTVARISSGGVTENVYKLVFNWSIMGQGVKPSIFKSSGCVWEHAIFSTKTFQCKLHTGCFHFNSFFTFFFFTATLNHFQPKQSASCLWKQWDDCSSAFILKTDPCLWNAAGAEERRYSDSSEVADRLSVQVNMKQVNQSLRFSQVDSWRNIQDRLSEILSDR